MDGRPRVFDPGNRAWYAPCIFLSAFLLFEVQPLIAKEILPWFGGSAGVWTTCMLFFQMLLLAGYAYAHWVSRDRHRWVHTALLVAGMLMCRIVPGDWWKPPDGRDPAWRILCLLTVTAGLPYFTLACTSPLLQAWYARQHRAAMPYRFFALSNLASLLALLSYPVLVEPRMPLHRQAWGWSGAYLMATALHGWLFRQSSFSSQRDAAGEAAAPAAPAAPVAPFKRPYIQWMVLSACASALLLAVTNHITQNVAAIPLFWVLPLGVYLLSFILTFDGARWYGRRWFLPLLAVALAAMAYAVDQRSDVDRIGLLIPVLVGGLFICCMVCHGELAACAPAAEALTSFYLMVALGGAAGALFVAILSPVIFPAILELPVLLVVQPAVILGVLLANRRPGGAAKPLAAPSRGWRRMAAGVGAHGFWAAWIVSAVGVAGLGSYLAVGEWEDLGKARRLERNFYGALRVADDQELGLRELAHGTISHGEQYLDPAKRRRPLTYYAPSTGIGLLMTALAGSGPLRIGVIGLGTGSMAAWGRAGDVMRFYEINERVLDIARTQFTFLADSKSRIDIVLGDARLSLEREPDQHFDVLVVDAFSGDSIPVHLLTREAFELYFRHLKPDGTLAVHVSNLYLGLAPPVAALARTLGREAHLIRNEEDDETRTFPSDWVLVGDQEAKRFDWIGDREMLIPLLPGLRIWTDDFSNLWQSLSL
jgi:SAM-dependent methyltransferase